MDPSCLCKNGWLNDDFTKKTTLMELLQPEGWKEMPSLVKKTVNGEYYIPNIVDEGYGSISNGNSPVKSLLPETTLKPTYLGGTPFGNKNAIKPPGFDNFGGYGASKYRMAVNVRASDSQEVFSRKVFVGGLPIDVKEADLYKAFCAFGPLVIDWPRKSGKETIVSTNSTRTTTGYVFLVYEKESSVQKLVSTCYEQEGRYYTLVSSPTMPKKPVQVRPWLLSDMDYVYNDKAAMDPRRTVFVGGVPRPSRAKEIASALQTLYGHVAYVGIDIDPELNYPKGAARITFSRSESYIAAIRGKFVHIPHGEVQKRVDIKPYLMEDQLCDECEGRRCNGRYAQYFCGEPECVQYYCEMCWDIVHNQEDGTLQHKPLVRCGEQTKQLDRPPHHTNLHATQGGYYGHRQRHSYF